MAHESSGAAFNHDSTGFGVVAAMVRGSIGFGIVGLAAFSVWAFGGKWFQNHFGQAGLYTACALVFLALSGLLLHPLVPGPGSFARFYMIFIPAFLVYAIVWCAAWFVLRFGLGEWFGSLAGTAGFVAVVGWRAGKVRGLLQTILVVFGFHSAGYFSGGQLMYWLLGPGGAAMFSGLSKPGLLVVAKLAWGLLYGLGFGAGIGYAFKRCTPQQTVPTEASKLKSEAPR